MRKKFTATVTDVASRAKAAALVGATTLMAMPGFAMAQSGDFDGAEIIAKVATYVAIGITILAAFALGRWTLRAMGLIGGK